MIEKILIRGEGDFSSLINAAKAASQGLGKMGKETEKAGDAFGKLHEGVNSTASKMSDAFTKISSTIGFVGQGISTLVQLAGLARQGFDALLKTIMGVDLSKIEAIEKAYDRMHKRGRIDGPDPRKILQASKSPSSAIAMGWDIGMNLITGNDPIEEMFKTPEGLPIDRILAKSPNSVTTKELQELIKDDIRRGLPPSELQIMELRRRMTDESKLESDLEQILSGKTTYGPQLPPGGMPKAKLEELMFRANPNLMRRQYAGLGGGQETGTFGSLLLDTGRPDNFGKLFDFSDPFAGLDTRTQEERQEDARRKAEAAAEHRRKLLMDEEQKKQEAYQAELNRIDTAQTAATAGISIATAIFGRKRALLVAEAMINGGMEGARAAAAFAAGNVVGGLAHLAAAAQFFAVAKNSGAGGGGGGGGSRPMSGFIGSGGTGGGGQKTTIVYVTDSPGDPHALAERAEERRRAAERAGRIRWSGSVKFE